MHPQRTGSSSPPPPFSLTCTPQVPELLHNLGCTIAISTYQAGKVIFISAKDANNLVQLPRNFDKAMGIALKGDKMALAARQEILILVNSPDLAWYYPKQPQTYDSFFIPQAAYFTGMVDMHDIDFGDEGIWGINTSFSCLCLIDDNYHFIPKWQPKFITELASEDRCHLNGLTVVDGKPKYVTALGSGNTPQSWRENIVGGGLLIDVDSSEHLLEGLAMPHSPRMINGNLYLLLSATGEIIKVDPEAGKYEVVNKIDGFVRGLAHYQDYLFVGLSKLRQNSSTFKHLSIAKKANQAGIAIYHLPTGAFVGAINYLASVDEIYDVQILPEIRRAGILNTQTDWFRRALAIPGATFWGQDVEPKQK